ncbi:hypothetical protein NDU88_002377 [Pleurodeles waltl]|uniref:Secreted protein n=1 Tax=Pleurodeles waltl TaxID=8319 RepID=A0AAV7W1P7_PLEWA|nr:hypothetical protein NDU88_002377 [Pleurodeles waltl]
MDVRMSSLLGLGNGGSGCALSSLLGLLECAVVCLSKTAGQALVGMARCYRAAFSDSILWFLLLGFCPWGRRGPVVGPSQGGLLVLFRLLAFRFSHLMATWAAGRRVVHADCLVLA